MSGDSTQAEEFFCFLGGILAQRLPEMEEPQREEKEEYLRQDSESWAEVTEARPEEEEPFCQAFHHIARLYQEDQEAEEAYRRQKAESGWVLYGTGPISPKEPERRPPLPEENVEWTVVEPEDRKYPTAFDCVEVLKSIAEDAIEETREISDELERSQRRRKNQLQTLKRWNAKADGWGFGGLATAIAQQIDAVKKHQAGKQKKEGTVPARRNKPYGKALGQIAEHLESWNVEYAPFLAVGILWHSGFSDMVKVVKVIPPPAETVLVYQERRWELQAKSSHGRRRIQRYESGWLRFLEQTHRSLVGRRPNLANFFKRYLSREEERIGTPRKKRRR